VIPAQGLTPREHLARAEVLLEQAESEAPGSQFHAQTLAELAQAHAQVAALALIVAVVDGRLEDGGQE
jgi:hypothetical protein